MKIIQTYWSLPSQKNEANAVEGRNSGGFVSEKHHAMSWALSCLKFKQFYTDVKLYTDKKGMAWLVDELGLSYTDVECSLDSLNHYNPLLWALPKVHVYGLQNEPFIHVDGDIYIWKAFDDALTKQRLIVQNPEDDAEYLKKILAQVVKVFTNIPDYLLDGFNYILNFPQVGDILNVSINAGIFGGNDIEFIKKYSTESIKFVNDNILPLNRIDVGPFNLIFEQLFFKIFAQKNNIPISCLFEEESRSNIFLSAYYFLCVPQKHSFIHLFGPTKRVALQYMQMEARLKQEFPKMHQHITQKYASIKAYPITNNKGKNDDTYSTTHITDAFKYTITLLERMHLQHNSNNYEELCDFVENIVENDPSDRALLLSDVFQIEKIKRDIHYNANTPEFSIITELVEQSYSNPHYLIDADLEFSLNKQNTGIAYLYHHFELLSDGEDFLEKIFTSGNFPILNGETNKLYIQKHIKDNVEKIKYQYLEDWDVLLPLFDGNYVTIKELIQEIKESDMFYDGENMESDIADFVFHCAFNRRCLLFRKRKK